MSRSRSRRWAVPVLCRNANECSARKHRQQKRSRDEPLAVPRPRPHRRQRPRDGKQRNSDRLNSDPNRAVPQDARNPTGPNPTGPNPTGPQTCRPADGFVRQPGPSRSIGNCRHDDGNTNATAVDFCPTPCKHQPRRPSSNRTGLSRIQRVPSPLGWKAPTRSKSGKRSGRDKISNVGLSSSQVSEMKLPS